MAQMLKSIIVKMFEVVKGLLLERESVQIKEFVTFYPRNVEGRLGDPSKLPTRAGYYIEEPLKSQIAHKPSSVKSPTKCQAQLVSKVAGLLFQS